MKKIITTAIITVGLFVAQADAQKSSRTPEEQAKNMTTQMVKNLELSEEQEDQVYEINLQAAQERAELRKTGQRPDRDAMQARMKEMNERYKSVLTAEQFAKYEKMRTERRGQMRNSGTRRPGGNMPDTEAAED